MAVFAVLVIGYGYFLQETVDDVITRSHVEEEVAQIRSDIGNAEEKFGSNIGTATLKKARKLGFREITSSRFVTRSIDSNAFASANVRN
jgi:hypothetical protein